MTEQPEEMQRKLKDLFWKLTGRLQLVLGTDWGLKSPPDTLQSGCTLTEQCFSSHTIFKLHHFKLHCSIFKLERNTEVC